MLIAVAVAGGAAIGAPCRYLLDRAVQARHQQHFPWGTMVINLLGSAVLGVLLGWAAASASASVGADGSASGFWPHPTPSTAVLLAAVGTGWCGAFTTYSTFSYETIQLARNGLALRAVANIVLAVIGGLGMATLGVIVGRAIGG